MGEQIALFDTGPAIVQAEPDSTDFWSSYVPPLPVEGMAKYLICEWGKGDPERSPRDGSDMGALWRRAIKAETVEQHKEIIAAHLADGIERTFNRICVELYDKTAIAMLELPPELAMWALTADGVIEHTNEGPIRWRMKAKS